MTEQPRIPRADRMLRTVAEGSSSVYQAGGDQIIVDYSVQQYERPAPGARLAWASPESVRTPMVSPLSSPLRDRHDLRGELLRAIRDPARAVTGLHVVYGMPGSGKTALAQTVFDEAVAGCGVVGLWVNACDEPTFRSGMLAVAHDRGASQQEVDAAREGRRADADLVWHYLDRSPDPWLLVLDDADDPAVFRHGAWLRSSRRGIVLITTRRGDAAEWRRGAAPHRLDVLDVSYAVDVLRDLAVSAQDTATLELLARRLGCHPLALSLAGAYLGRQLLEAVSVDEYLKRLDSDPALLDRGAAPGEQELRRLITSTWQISLDALTEQGVPESTTLLRLLSCFASSPLPVGLLTPAGIDGSGLPHATPPLTGDHANSALGGLMSHSLVTVREDDAGTEGAGVRSVQAHPLLLETVFSRMPVDQRVLLLESAAGLLRRLLSTDSDRFVDPRTLRLFTPHASALLGHAAAHRAEAATELALSVVRDLRDQSYVRGDFPTTRTLADEAARVTDGQMSAEALTDRHEQGRALAALGLFDDAATVHEATLRARESVLGPDHPDTLSSAHALGIALYGLGRWAEDEHCMRRAAEGRAAVLGTAHPDTIDSRGRLAEAIGQQRRWSEARRLAAENLAVSEQALGDDHPHTLLSRIALAWVLAGIGEWDEAAAHTRATLEGSERVLGADHPRTLAARQRLADVLSHLGQWPQALEAAQSVRAARQQILGPEHPHTLSVEILLSRILRGMGRVDEARQLAADRLTVCIRVLGDDHPDTLVCRTEYEVASRTPVQRGMVEEEDGTS
ncbi:tetratricopeptide repeat protein [Streptomyces sp. Amel2xC10]|uniref:tetratricopeptide repeat protein n=1 Tax=Streptomyces sp. Amel2xC10 TaxID=1305826 RepID=UPI000A084812|nr:tetratricopeptide repeat protein [Streptomyces sp. Amel2xC10]SMF86310.1 NB-ARC domain-containing protein [Streptomyces sp. Amel2xC10]